MTRLDSPGAPGCTMATPGWDDVVRQAAATPPANRTMKRRVGLVTSPHCKAVLIAMRFGVVSGCSAASPKAAGRWCGEFDDAVAISEGQSGSQPDLARCLELRRRTWQHLCDR